MTKIKNINYEKFNNIFNRFFFQFELIIFLLYFELKKNNYFSNILLLNIKAIISKEI